MFLSLCCIESLIDRIGVLQTKQLIENECPRDLAIMLDDYLVSRLIEKTSPESKIPFSSEEIKELVETISWTRNSVEVKFGDRYIRHIPLYILINRIELFFTPDNLHYRGKNINELYKLVLNVLDRIKGQDIEKKEIGFFFGQFCKFFLVQREMIKRHVFNVKLVQEIVRKFYEILDYHIEDSAKILKLTEDFV